MVADEQTPPKDAPAPESGSSTPGSTPTTPAPPDAASPSSESATSREEKIAAARAKAEALKAQRAAAGAAPGAQAGAAPAAPTKPAAPPRQAPAAGLKGWATAENPGGGPPSPPQNPQVQAFGTITQSVELRCETTEDQNIRKILGGLGVYRNPLRGVWQLDYRYYAEAVERLQAAGYHVEGKDYLGRPLDQWAPERRGWTRLS